MNVEQSHIDSLCEFRYDALVAPDMSLLVALHGRREREKRQREEEIARLDDDPFNAENQKRIADLIRERTVASNMEQACVVNWKDCLL